MKTASMLKRVIAVIIDGLLVSFFATILADLAVAPGFFRYQLSAFQSSLIGVMLTVAYHTYLEGSLKSATFGKQVVGIYVVDAAGGRLSYRKAFHRSLGRLIPLGWFLALFTDNERALHDFIGDSRVVE